MTKQTKKTTTAKKATKKFTSPASELAADLASGKIQATKDSLGEVVLKRLASDSNAALEAKGELSEVTAAPVGKPLVDLTKISTKGLRAALKQETSMAPSVALAYRTELESREAVAKPQAAPAKKAGKTVKAGATKKADKKPAELKLRLYAKGEFFFPRAAAEKLNGATHMKFAAKGKTVTLTPTKSAKDSQKVMFCHASPVLRVAKLLADTGWSKATQDLAVKMVGEAFQVEVR